MEKGGEMTEYQPEYDSPYPCKVCGDRHVNAEHPTVVNFFEELLADVPDAPPAAQLAGTLAADLRHEYVPDTGLPGKPAKYTTPEAKRAANREYQRRHREKYKHDNSDES